MVNSDLRQLLIYDEELRSPQVTFCFANDNEDVVKKRIHQIFGYDTSQECVSGHVNILKWEALFTILHMTLPVTPVYAMILILRRRILMKLCKNEAISENSRRLHAQLLKRFS
ncbi:hypothetical protein NECAME_17688 [Necator americanus]|uniref:Uncharacterized protein n=1 Tax=Necator americanus TaxID=51031 RepID=W2TLK3_NECAM|nr:hypothetical protein NECAME_17688 [Necator americanus]ETN82509.1 hypothetical protein NECAME_17688 [Necator americanus]